MSELKIHPLQGEETAVACAHLMAGSEPWLTLGRSYEASLQILQDPAQEVYVGWINGRLTGFIVLVMQGAFVGYIQSVAVPPDWRGQGIGSRLIAFAEERIFRDSPNVFMCVSSFNQAAYRLYRRLGYETVGALRDYIVAGHDEILLRKTRGPIRAFRRAEV